MKSLPLLLLFNNLFLVAHSLPYLVLSSKSQKCIGIDPPRRTVVSITYHFPDVVPVVEKDDGDAAAESVSETESKKYNHDMKNLMQNGNDVSVTLFQRFTDNSAAFRRRSGGKQDRGTVRSRNVITDPSGMLFFTTAPEDDGVLEMCVQSLKATETDPVRFSLKVEMSPYVPEAVKEEKKSQNSQVVDGHVSRMQTDIKGLERKLEMIMNTVEWTKEQEIKVHDRAISMNRASQYWPMFHILVLIITGYTQASHIAKFFRRHHIV
eukprot:CAMPEP_0119013742 /NCGR_PEP_ID=MMETSP1176-20130426/8881_1 /TAXON_ID=265551 /ORGANISM="Synedropsis recta cf, Strain CCMP1620" /LENGTH=264 /DNA_ID=CAMNT_0006966855 /DNA_START=50 /DNA_END=847 /DNA_ORIENTATION=-